MATVKQLYKEYGFKYTFWAIIEYYSPFEWLKEIAFYKNNSK